MLEEIHVPPCLSDVSWIGQSRCAQSLAGHGNREPRGNTRDRSSLPCAWSNSTRSTCHGAVKPRAAVNNPVSSIPGFHTFHATHPSTDLTQSTGAIGVPSTPATRLPRRFRSSAPRACGAGRLATKP